MPHALVWLGNYVPEVLAEGEPAGRLGFGGGPSSTPKVPVLTQPAPSQHGLLEKPLLSVLTLWMKIRVRAEPLHTAPSVFTKGTPTEVKPPPAAPTPRNVDQEEKPQTLGTCCPPCLPHTTASRNAATLADKGHTTYTLWSNVTPTATLRTPPFF